MLDSSNRQAQNILKKGALAAVFLTQLLLTACGGGGSGGSSSNAGSSNENAPSTGQISPTQSAAVSFTGVYKHSGTQACGYIFNNRFPSPIQVIPDMLVVDSDNVGYRLCGDDLVIGTVFGTSNTSTSQAVSEPFNVTFDVYDETSGLKYKSINMTGVATASSGIISTIDLSSSNSISSIDPGASVTFHYSRAGATEGITHSYSTLAGNYKEGEFYAAGVNAPATGVLTVASDGTFFGNGTWSDGSSKGSISAGRIMKFDPVTGIHKITANVTIPSGGAVTMTGIMAPAQTSANAADPLAGVAIAMAGSGHGFIAYYVKKP